MQTAMNSTGLGGNGLGTTGRGAPVPRQIMGFSFLHATARPMFGQTPRSAAAEHPPPRHQAAQRHLLGNTAPLSTIVRGHCGRSGDLRHFDVISGDDHPAGSAFAGLSG